MKKTKPTKKKKSKIVYLEDKGETIYSMAALSGRTPEEQEEFDNNRKKQISVTKKERWAMIAAAFTVYGPLLLCVIGAFVLTAVFLYLFLI